MKKFTFLLSVSATLCSVTSFAQFGSTSLDITFGNGGKVETSAALKDSSTKMALQSDGKILVVGTADQDGTPNYGDFKIARYNADGTLDISFGTNGIVITDMGGDDIASGIAVQSDGRIVVVGTTRKSAAQQSNFAIARYRADDGRLDRSFGPAGKVFVDDPDGLNDFGGGVAIQASGKILVFGTCEDRATKSLNYAMFRLNNTDGTQDMSFGNAGFVSTDFNLNDDIGNGITTQSDGKIVAVGSTVTSLDAGGIDFGIVRYDENGILDPGFGTGGKLVKDLYLHNNIAYGVAIQPADGKICIVGDDFRTLSNGSLVPRMAIFRCNTDGTTDSTFSLDGIRKLFLKFSSSRARGVAIQIDGKILVGGSVKINETLDPSFAFARLLTDGKVDTNGKVITTSFTYTQSTAFSIATQPADNKIVLAGVAINTNTGDGEFALARYMQFGILPVNFVSFNASKKDNSIALIWETASEVNNNYFTIERSVNGSTGFIELGRVASKNTTGSQSYNFEDIAPVKGGNYYRIKQVDADGASTYSKTIFIDFAGKGIVLIVYPNPVKDVINIKGLAVDVTTSLTISDLNGRICAQAVSSNSSTYTWDIKRLPVGTYMLRVGANNKFTTLKFVKQ